MTEHEVPHPLAIKCPACGAARDVWCTIDGATAPLEAHLSRIEEAIEIDIDAFDWASFT